MDTYDFIRGPLVWIAFAVFLGGSLFRLIMMGKLAQKEGTVFPTMDFKHGTRSIRHWMVPFASKNMRMHPLFTVVSFAFHICLLITPLLVMGHSVLWEESFGFSWWSLPAGVADVMTLVVIFGCGFFIARRLVAPEVRNVTSVGDILVVLLVVAPFLTGFVAHRQWLPGETLTVLHIISGAAWLMAIPFTRLSHVLWFFFTRAFMGSEFGAVRNARDW